MGITRSAKYDFFSSTRGATSISLTGLGGVGPVHLEKMQALAAQGRGLNSYIYLHVKKAHADKW